MALRRQTLSDHLQFERDARELAREVRSGSTRNFRRASGDLKRRTREIMAETRLAKGDVKVLTAIVRSEGKELKREGHGLTKQLQEYRPQIEKYRAERELVRRPDPSGESVPFIAKGGKLIYIQSDNEAVRKELMEIWVIGQYRAANLYKFKSKSFRDARTGKRYTVETDMYLVQQIHDALPSDYHKRVYRRAGKAVA